MSEAHTETHSESKGKSYSNLSITASTSVPVSDKYMGTVIGKGGKTIENIKKQCGVRIRTLQPKPGEGHLFNSFKITGEPRNVDKAAKWVRSIIGNTYKHDHPDEFPVDENETSHSSE